jgi:hypothetical protein
VTLLDPPLFAPDGSLIPAAAGVSPPA